MAKMHDHEVETDVHLVRRLLAAQFPEWADLPVERVGFSGTDHAMYRLGDDLAVRLPRIENAVLQLEKEQRWLPVLAPGLPLAVPVPVGFGHPAESFPWRWSVYRWLPGRMVTVEEHTADAGLATALAAFARALHTVDAAGGPPPGRHNFGRGRPLAEREEYTRDAIERSAGLVDGPAVTAAWEADLAAPPYAGPPVWVHGDLQPSNLLVTGDRLTGVIDFGGLGVGDPAVDLLPAWNLFRGEARAAFREAAGVDDATWARGRGWALSVALVQLPYYVVTNPYLVESSYLVIREVLADVR